MNILSGVAIRGRRLLAAAAVVAAVGFMAVQAKPASADFTGINLAKPDLAVSMSAVETNYPGGGISARMRIVVENKGLKAAGAFQVSVRDQNGVLKQTFTVNGLAVGGKTVLYHNLPNFDCGDAHTRVARADSGNAIAELNESNNSAQWTYIYPTC
jgi:hypothetical protein